jgi:DNA-binding transcriptional LysR family regulator
LRPQAERAVQQFEAAIDSARRADAGVPVPVRVGFVTLGLLGPLSRALRQISVTRPDVSVRLEEGATAALLDRVADGRLDLALVHPMADPPPSLAVTEVRRDRIVAALPASHPLGGRRSVSLRTLAAEPLIFFPRSASPDLYAALRGAYRAQGLDPRIEQEARSTPTMMLLVAAGLGYALVAESARSLPFSNVAFVPVSDLPDDLHWGLALACRPDAAEPAARDLAQLLLG